MLSAAVCSVQQERDEEPEDDGEEELRDGGLPCNVNRGGFPVDEETWDRMWRHVARIHPSGELLEKEIRGATDLPKVQELGSEWTRCKTAMRLESSNTPPAKYGLHCTFLSNYNTALLWLMYTPMVLFLFHLSIVTAIEIKKLFKQRLAHMATLSVCNEYWVCLRITQFVWMLCTTDSITDCAYIPTHHHDPTATGSHTEIHQGFAVSLQSKWMVWF